MLILIDIYHIDFFFHRYPSSCQGRIC